MKYGKRQAIALSTLGLLITGVTAFTAEHVVAGEAVKQTFVVQGLHCPPCTGTVESALKRAKGIESVKADWKSKSAWITFDESAISAQQVAQAIAATPHMMGRGMHYQASLALKVPELKGDASAEKVKTALSAVPGVSVIYTYPQQQSIAVRFSGTDKVTTADLIAALKKAGFEAAPFN